MALTVGTQPAELPLIIPGSCVLAKLTNLIKKAKHGFMAFIALLIKFQSLLFLLPSPNKPEGEEFLHFVNREMGLEID